MLRVGAEFPSPTRPGVKETARYLELRLLQLEGGHKRGIHLFCGGQIEVSDACLRFFGSPGGMASFERGVRIILENELNLFRGSLSEDMSNCRQSIVNARRDPACRHQLAIHDHTTRRVDGTASGDGFDVTPMAGGLLAVQKADCAQDKHPRTNRMDMLGALCLPADEIQKLLIADRIEDAWPTGDAQELGVRTVVEGRGCTDRKAAIGRNRVTAGRHYMHFGVGGIGKELCGSREVELGDSGKNRDDNIERHLSSPSDEHCRWVYREAIWHNCQ